MELVSFDSSSPYSGRNLECTKSSFIYVVRAPKKKIFSFILFILGSVVVKYELNSAVRDIIFLVKYLLKVRLNEKFTP